MRLVVTGDSDAQAALSELGRLPGRLESEVFPGVLRITQGFIRLVSPVDTGAYRGSHTIEGTNRLMVDPNAMNRGRPVTDYAGVIEAREGVYQRGAEFAGVELLRQIKELLNGVK